MSVEDVAAAIRRVRPRLREYQHDYPDGLIDSSAPANNCELSTRYVVVDPILRSLGWDLSDPFQCVVEHATVRGRDGKVPRVDYALLGRDGNLAVLVEVKRLECSGRFAPNEREGIRKKTRRRWNDGSGNLLDYLYDAGTAWAGVLTNGQEWGFVSLEGDKWVWDEKTILLGSRRIVTNSRWLQDCLARDRYW